MASYNGDLTDTVDTAEAVTAPVLFSVDVEDDSIVSGRDPDPFDLLWKLVISATSPVGISAWNDVVRTQSATATDTVTLATTVSALWGAVVRERVGILDSPGPITTFSLFLDEVGRVLDSVRGGHALSLADTTLLTEAATYTVAFLLTDSAAFSDLLSGGGVYRLSIAEQARILALLGRVLRGDLTDAVGLAGSLSGVALFSQILIDTVGVAETLTAPLILQVVTAETAELTVTDARRAGYHRDVPDTMALTARYLAPSGSVTTWALNTRNRAVTEYTGYEFNSFGQIASRYVGASSTGLYELTGDTDDGSDIIAAIRTGALQIAGSRFTAFKAAYLGIRGGGEFVLKIESGDGQSYTYTVTAHDMRTTKVNIGKGLRARYFALELTSTGQDFDLESIEFVPVAARRRV